MCEYVCMILPSIYLEQEFELGDLSVIFRVNQRLTFFSVAVCLVFTLFPGRLFHSRVFFFCLDNYIFTFLP